MQEFRLRIVHDRRKKLKNGTDRASVEIEIGISGSEKRKWISTGVSLSKSELKCIHPLQIKGANSLPEQKYKEEKIIETYDKIRAFTNSPYCHCLDDVSNGNKNKFININFIDFLEEQIEKSDVVEGTKKSYRSLLARLKEFSKIVSFKDLTYRNILEFDKHLRKTINSIKTLQKRHKLMEKTINEAIKIGYLVENPYDKFDMPKGSNYRTPVSLTKEELRLIEEYKPKSQSMSKYKDMFLLQCYTGLAYVDMQQLSILDIETIEGVKAIRSNREKTDSCFIVPLSQKAESILKQYEYKMPQKSNARYNQALKDLANRTGIQKNLTTHVARHTFATILINDNVAINDLSKMLGHNSIRQT